MSDAGKGDRPRPFDRKRWDEGWAKAFGACTHTTRQLQRRPEFYCIDCADLADPRRPDLWFSLSQIEALWQLPARTKDVWFRWGTTKLPRSYTVSLIRRMDYTLATCGSAKRPLWFGKIEGRCPGYHKFCYGVSCYLEKRLPSIGVGDSIQVYVQLLYTPPQQETGE